MSLRLSPAQKKQYSLALVPKQLFSKIETFLFSIIFVEQIVQFVKEIRNFFWPVLLPYPTKYFLFTLNLFFFRRNNIFRNQGFPTLLWFCIHHGGWYIVQSCLAFLNFLRKENNKTKLKPTKAEIFHKCTSICFNKTKINDWKAKYIGDLCPPIFTPITWNIACNSF